MSYPISSSLLDGIVLAVVERESTYGYRITQDVQKVLDISESTLYPVLRRLMKDGCLTTYDQAYAGRNRRYYQITEHGRAALRQHRIDWQNYRSGIDTPMSTMYPFTSMLIRPLSCTRILPILPAGIPMSSFSV